MYADLIHTSSVSPTIKEVDRLVYGHFTAVRERNFVDATDWQWL